MQEVGQRVLSLVVAWPVWTGFFLLVSVFAISVRTADLVSMEMYIPFFALACLAIVRLYGGSGFNGDKSTGAKSRPSVWWEWLAAVQRSSCFFLFCFGWVWKAGSFCLMSRLHAAKLTTSSCFYAHRFRLLAGINSLSGLSRHPFVASKVFEP